MTIESNIPLDAIFQALAHNTRRQIVERLIREPGVSAGAFTDQFDVAQPTLSRHLAQLERAGLITRQVEGRSHIFFANPETLKTADMWMSDHRSFWSANLNRLGILLDGKAT